MHSFFYYLNASYYEILNYFTDLKCVLQYAGAGNEITQYIETKMNVFILNIST